MSKSGGQRILLVAGHYCPLVGGAQAVYDALARELPDNIQILTSKRDYMTGEYVEGADAFDEAAPYKITRIDRMRPDRVSEKVGISARFLQKLQSISVYRNIIYSIEQLHTEHPLDTIVVGASDAMTWLLNELRKNRKLRHVKLVLYTHGEEVSQTPPSPSLASKRREALGICDRVIAVSNFTVDVLTERYMVARDKISLVQNGVNFRDYATGNASEGNAPPKTGKQVVGIGRLVARKGFDALVRVWPRVLETNPDAQLVIIGDGPEAQQLRAQIEELTLEKCIQLLTDVSKTELIATLQSSDLFVMPNCTLPDGDTEGFGLVFLEAAAAGLACIGGAYGGATDAILHEKTGLLVDSKNDDLLAGAIVRLLSDHDLRTTMGAAARQHAKDNDWSRKAGEFMAAIAQIESPETRSQTL